MSLQISKPVLVLGTWLVENPGPDLDEAVDGSGSIACAIELQVPAAESFAQTGPAAFRKFTRRGLHFGSVFGEDSVTDVRSEGSVTDVRSGVGSGC